MWWNCLLLFVLVKKSWPFLKLAECNLFVSIYYLAPLVCSQILNAINVHSAKDAALDCFAANLTITKCSLSGRTDETKTLTLRHFFPEIKDPYLGIFFPENKLPPEIKSARVATMPAAVRKLCF